MKQLKTTHKDPLKIRKFAIYTAIIWTLLISVFLLLNIRLVKQEALNRAYTYTKVGFEKDILYRRWVAEHGGVYVKADSTTPPNPYLSHIPDRDIFIDSTLQFTLMNPAYMTRQVYELEQKGSAIQGHITSLNPLRPENAPDDWERGVLQAFENGIDEVAEVSQINGKDYFRFMKPFITEESCLKCHAHQGYKVNDIRGGVSVSYPLDQIYLLSESNSHYDLYIFIWLMGLVVIFVAHHNINKSDNKRLAAEEDLLIMNSQLEDRVQSRTQTLKQEIAERQKAEVKIQESQQRFQTIFNSVNDGIFLHNAKTGEILEVNRRTLEMFGFSYQEILKLSIGEISSNVSPYTQDEAAERISKALRGQAQVFEWRSKRKDGSLFWSEVNMRIASIDGNDRIIVSVRDVSDRKQVEKALHVE